MVPESPNPLPMENNDNYKLLQCALRMEQLILKLTEKPDRCTRCPLEVSLPPVPCEPVAEKTVYRSAAYAVERVGVSASTLLRCQQRGEIAVAKTHKKKKYYLDSDVERLRKSYRDR